MKKLDILGSETKIEIKILERLYPESIGSWEGDWVKAVIRVEIPGYSANFLADLRTEEFKEFRDQLAAMNQNLEGPASLISIENAIEAKAVMDSLGGIYWEVSTRYPISTGAVLTFAFGSDQSYLNQLVKELDEVLAEFPMLEHQNDLKSHATDFFRKIRSSKRK
ncbi:WapI family immunity protein [Planococcus sp. SE5232]|uniref:WapI family immunity protein n=1 Tax=unclassified Planococcus (in: firmicutes) TaxID=2662419 RepID=UPI003D6AB457